MKRLTQIVAEALGIEERELPAEAALHETEAWTSLTHIELVVSLEEAYGIELSEQEIVEMTSLAAIRDVLRKGGVAAE